PGHSPRSTCSWNRRHRRKRPAAARPGSLRKKSASQPPMITDNVARRRWFHERQFVGMLLMPAQPGQYRRIHLARIGVAEIVNLAIGHVSAGGRQYSMGLAGHL